MTRILIIGPQGVGKGTQAAGLAEALSIPHVSTGDLFRDHAARGTELGLEVKRYLDSGQLVPDSVTKQMVAERLGDPDALDGFLLDGFPRTLPQAEWLDEYLHSSDHAVDAVLLLNAPNKVLLERLTARGRADDTPEAISTRLALYHSETTPLLDFYHDRVVAVNGVGTVDEVRERALKALRDFLNGHGRAA
ncbi:adenylate kinase [Nakamurella leprariae]|uniref:Adenylate kinase n=1 Tax=Nakamurella leprariae TaxID=2803911 RepID=A0A938YCX9_9ACTN|nr:adenylate kinase [Nakamurella leprariae]MBM9467539.1 adenylate kinase [Nakamurella leprariae]